MHIYEISPTLEGGDDVKPEGEGETPADAIPPVKYSYLALCQRKLDLVPEPFLHPFQLGVFGSPLLLRVRELEGYTGEDLYALVSERMQRFVPHRSRAGAPGGNHEQPQSKDNGGGDDDTLERTNSRTIRRGRHHREKTLSDDETVAAGDVPPYGFRLRLVSRDGAKCALSSWYECCVGSLVPCDDAPVIAMCGDSISIDWHMSVDLTGGGFGWDAGKAVAAGGNDGPGGSVMMRPHERALALVPKHPSCGSGGKRYGRGGSITLEECLDSFAEEEKIPDVYCSKCRDLQVQTKRMNIWRYPPLVMIHLKRFQFTQHMRRKLRDLVVFPIEGLDLSRIAAPSSGRGPADDDGEGTPDGDAGREDPAAAKFTGGDFHPLSKSNRGRTESLYDLYAVVHHQGALSGGHYVASLKSEEDGKWRLFNDAQIYELSSKDVVDPSAYILFYVRRDVKGASLEDFWDTEEREGEGLTEEEVQKLMKTRDSRCVIS